MSRYAILVVWKDGDCEYLKEMSGRNTTFPNRKRAQEQADFMREGMDDVQSISIVDVGRARAQRMWDQEKALRGGR